MYVRLSHSKQPNVSQQRARNPCVDISRGLITGNMLSLVRGVCRHGTLLTFRVVPAEDMQRKQAPRAVAGAAWFALRIAGTQVVFRATLLRFAISWS